MSLGKPSRIVEWTSDFASWSDVSDDVARFEVAVEDLVLGAWSFILVLGNKAGKYDAVFPSIDGEVGLHCGFRFTVNGKLLGVFRANSLAPSFDESVGDVLVIAGLGLGEEACFKFCKACEYPMYNADQIIYDQGSKIGFSDLSIPGGSSAPRYTVFIPKSGRQTFRELIVELEDAVEYSAFFDSREKPASFKFFLKTDNTKRLNTVLRSVLGDSTNNILSGKNPRALDSLRNTLSLQDFGGATVYFRTDVPNDRDAWTETLSTLFGVHWGVTVGTLELDEGTPRFLQPTFMPAIGANCIKCTGHNADRPWFSLFPANSYYGVPFNPDVEDVDQLYFFWRNTLTTNPPSPQVGLSDTQVPAKKIYHAFSASQDTWAGRQLNVGAPWAGWSGDVGAFNGNITEITFFDVSNPQYTLDKSVWVDGLYFFKSGGYEEAYFEDAASIAKYGKREEELALPSAYPFLNLKVWGYKMLQKHSSPSRTVTVRAKIDPALVMEDDGVTAASFLPGWLLQVHIPRWGIRQVSEGGVWWRILKATYFWQGPPDGFFLEFTLVSTGAESPENYSFTDATRLLKLQDPVAGRLRELRVADRAKNSLLGRLKW